MINHISRPHEELERRLDHYISIAHRCKDHKNIVEHSQNAFIKMYEMMKANGYATREIHDTFYERWSIK